MWKSKSPALVLGDKVDRQQKEELIATLRKVVEQTAIVLLVRNEGLSVGDFTELRRNGTKVGVTIRVAKNRLVRRALAGSDEACVDDWLVGPLALVTSQDPVSAAKVVVNYAKKNPKLVIVGAAMGTERLESERVKALADLPSLDELHAKLIGLLRAPATKIAQTLNAPAVQVARVLHAKAKSEEA